MIKLLPLILLCSCASYVQKFHRQFDGKKETQRRSATAPDTSRYKNPFATNDRRPIKNPITLGGANNINSVRNMNFVSNDQRKRYTANDLTDQGESSSLWDGKNSESFLFVNNNIKRKGDIVIVEVMRGMKDNITSELKRAFPKEIKKDGDSEKEKTEKTAQVDSNSKSNEIYDKISSTVIEEVNKDYLLIRGRKEVLYEKKKRFVEVQAIVARKDISSIDTVESTKVLEPRIYVLRY